MTAKLRIVFTVDPEIPVPPVHYGGIERIVNMLILELQRRGHEVHLFANPQSTIDTHLMPYIGMRSQSRTATLQNLAYVWMQLQRLGRVDIIHSFARLAYLLPLLPAGIPKIQSYQRHISPRSVRLGQLFGGSSLMFTSCSDANTKTANDTGGRWVTIYNGVETNKYIFRPEVARDASLVFLGRVERIKGAHTAIEVARHTGRKLIIAGNHAAEGAEAAYFKEEILPHCDGDRIRYVGPVDDEQKNDLLGGAAALLFPIDWEEPFGIVMVEALACGTPVIGYARGSVPEVIRDGFNGFVCHNVDEMITATGRLPEIKRENCRHDAETRFSAKAITEQYEALYFSLIAQRNLSK